MWKTFLRPNNRVPLRFAIAETILPSVVRHGPTRAEDRAGDHEHVRKCWDAAITVRPTWIHDELGLKVSRKCLPLLAGFFFFFFFYVWLVERLKREKKCFRVIFSRTQVQ